MGHKIFISYKYADSSVQKLERKGSEQTTVRDYVDDLQKLLTEEDQINQGEKDGEDLSGFKDSTIESKLRKKIYSSSVTIVMISPKMKDPSLEESDQWIPWEISYSLYKTEGKRRNGILAVVLPDANGSYKYTVEYKQCCQNGCRYIDRSNMFYLIKENMFNKNDKEKVACYWGSEVYKGNPSYIQLVRWSDFTENSNIFNTYINIAEDIREKEEEYDIKVYNK